MSINSTTINTGDADSSSTGSYSSSSSSISTSGCLFLSLHPSHLTSHQQMQCPTVELTNITQTTSSSNNNYYTEIGKQYPVLPTPAPFTDESTNKSTIIEILDANNPPSMLSSRLKQSKSSSSLNSITSTTSSSHTSNITDPTSTFITFNPKNAENIKPKRTNRACTACKAAHKKCSNTRPCTRCISLHREDKCVDSDSGRKRGRRANMPRSGGLLVHNYDPHNPFVSGKPNTVVFSLQHATNEPPNGIQKPYKKTKSTHAQSLNHQTSTRNPVNTPTHTPIHDASMHGNHVGMPIPTSHLIEHSSYPSSSTFPNQHAIDAPSSNQKMLPSINELTECKNVLSNSQSVFYHQ